MALRISSENSRKTNGFRRRVQLGFVEVNVCGRSPDRSGRNPECSLSVTSGWQFDHYGMRAPRRSTVPGYQLSRVIHLRWLSSTLEMALSSILPDCSAKMNRFRSSEGIAPNDLASKNRAFASPLRPPAISTSAARAPRCSIGSSPGTRAARSCCASRIPTSSATARSWSTAFWRV